MGDLKSGGVARVIFPIDPRNIFINSKMNDAYFCSPTVFCEDMIAGANDWYAVVGQSSNVLKNGALAMRIHPNGIFPYMVGGPVLG